MVDADWGQGYVEPLHGCDYDPKVIPAADALLAWAGGILGIQRWWGWQRRVLTTLLSRDPTNPELPMYATLVVVAPRQVGKSTLLDAIQLVWLATWHRANVLWSMHERQLARKRWLATADAAEFADPRRYQATRSIGGEVLTDRETGSKVHLVAPTERGPRGYSADLLVIDEAAFIPADYVTAARATTATKPHAVTLLASSAGDESSEVLVAERQAAIEGADGVGLLEWSAGEKLDGIDLGDREVWAKAIPTLDEPGGVTSRVVAAQRAAGSDADFAREYLSIWGIKTQRLALPNGVAGLATDVPDWAKSAKRWRIALDAAPDRSAYAIAAATGRKRDDGELDVVVVGLLRTASTHVMMDTLAGLREDNGDRPPWMANKIREDAARWDALSPAATFGLNRAHRDGANPGEAWPGQEMDTAEVVRSLTTWIVLSDTKRLTVYDPAGIITEAAEVAELRDIGDYGSGLRRKNGASPTTTITPLVAATFAAHAVIVDPYGWPKVTKP